MQFRLNTISWLTALFLPNLSQLENDGYLVLTPGGRSYLYRIFFFIFCKTLNRY